MKEVNDLLNRLGELEDAPLIWVNKKVYDMAQEIERLNNIINEFEKYLEETKGIYEEYICAIKKLKELKGVDKE